MAIGFPTYGLLYPFCFSLGHPWPICFLWDSLTLLLTLHSYGLLLISLDFPGPITLFSSLGFMGFPLTSYFLYLHYFGPAVVHSHFSISYTTHEYVISLFPGFFKPIYLLKAHLFISWAYDLLFLPFGLNAFAICLPTLCCPLPPLLLGFLLSSWILKNDPQQRAIYITDSLKIFQFLRSYMLLTSTTSLKSCFLWNAPIHLVWYAVLPKKKKIDTRIWDFKSLNS